MLQTLAFVQNEYIDDLKVAISQFKFNGLIDGLTQSCQKASVITNDHTAVLDKKADQLVKDSQAEQDIYKKLIAFSQQFEYASNGGFTHRNIACAMMAKCLAANVNGCSG